MNSYLRLLLLATLLNVAISRQFFSPGNDVRCARMWDEVGFSGNVVDCDTNERKIVGGRAESIYVREGCTLTVYDALGCRKRIERSSSDLSGWNKRISAACCECDGCQGPVAQEGLSCARLYENPKCSSCSGFRLEINPMDMVPHLQIFSDQISSLIVKDGCKLTAWEGQNYTGSVEVFEEALDNLKVQEWNDRISSLRCDCGGNH